MFEYPQSTHSSGQSTQITVSISTMFSMVANKMIYFSLYIVSNKDSFMCKNIGVFPQRRYYSVNELCI